VLRPFVEAYLIVAERLEHHEPAECLDEEAFLDECLGVAHQRRLQRRLASGESISLELLRVGLRLAAHRNLLGPGGDELTARRGEFADEIRAAVRDIAAIAERAGQSAQTP
jgi:glycerol-3-phosphate O-acyltransferase